MNSLYKILFCLLALSFTVQAFETFGDDPKADLQLFYNGLFEQASLADPTTLLDCYDNNAATVTLDFLGDLFSGLANNNAVEVYKAVQTYNTQLQTPIKKCLQANDDLKNLYAAYGISGKTLVQIGLGIIQYAATHYQDVHQKLLDLDTGYQGGDYQGSGKNLGVILQAVFKSGFKYPSF